VLKRLATQVSLECGLIDVLESSWLLYTGVMPYVTSGTDKGSGIILKHNRYLFLRNYNYSGEVNLPLWSTKHNAGKTYGESGRPHLRS
jgi:hypothetical protein